MPHYIVENFSGGLDRRRSAALGRVGTLRKLQDAYIDEGGEIRKRLAWVKNADLTAYGQDSNYKTKLTGPHPIPGFYGSVYFCHRHASLPSGGFWTAGGGGIATKAAIGQVLGKACWAVQTSTAISSPHLHHGSSVDEFGIYSYLNEKRYTSSSGAFASDFLEIEFSADEPVTVNNIAFWANKPNSVIFKQKGYFIDGTTLYASAVSDPGDHTGTGSGNLDFSYEDRSLGAGIALGTYYSELVVFTRGGAQFYSVDPDFSKTQYNRGIVLDNRSSRGRVSYGDGDVVYLGRSGIRSLQARDSSSEARITDVGSPIDPLIREVLGGGAGTGETTGSLGVALDFVFHDQCTGIVDSVTGQLWMTVNENVYVLSRFPSSEVLAWGIFTLPEVDQANESSVQGPRKSRWVADWAPFADTIMMRNYADEIFIYGGVERDTYDTTQAEAITPFMDLGTPGTAKEFTGIDVACTGTWTVYVSTIVKEDPDAVDWVEVATITGPGRSLDKIPIQFWGHQIAVRLVSAATAEEQTVGQIIIYYQEGVTK